VLRHILLPLVLAGCATFHRPELHYETARLTEVTLDTATLETVWLVDNPNGIDLKLARADCRVFVEDRPVATGAPPPGFVMPAHGKSELVFPAKVKLREVLPTAQAVAGKDFARYRVEGTAGIDTPVGVLDFPLNISGEFEVPKVPAMRLLAPALTGRGLEFRVELTNRNSFALPLGGLSGTVRVGAQELGSVSTGELALAPREQRVVKMPLNLNVLQAAGALESAMRGEKVPVTFNAELLSGGQRIPVDLNDVLELVK
jgi:LEA14-like dessication related protein